MCFPVLLAVKNFTVSRDFPPLLECLYSKNLSVDRWNSLWNVGIQPPKILLLWNSNDNVKNAGLWKSQSTLESGAFHFGFVWVFFTLSFSKKLCETYLWALLKGLGCMCVCVSILCRVQCFQMQLWIKINYWKWYVEWPVDYANTLSQVNDQNCCHLMAI